MNNEYKDENYFTVKVNNLYVIAFRDKLTFYLNRPKKTEIRLLELCEEQKEAFKFDDIERAEIVAKSISGTVGSHTTEYIKKRTSTLIRDYSKEDN